MKNYIFFLFNVTFGRIVRLFQKTLIIHKSPSGVFHQLDELVFLDSAHYALSSFSEAMQFDTILDLWSYCLDRIPQPIFDDKGVIAEFGVYKGESINFFAKNCPEATVFGFDSFEGLEEDWYGYRLRKGYFSTNGQMPICESNVKLIKGWFENTLPKFCRELQEKQILFLHMDADTYKPTRYVLNSIARNLHKGSIVVFDEYFGYAGWSSHEFKAWQETVIHHNIKC